MKPPRTLTELCGLPDDAFEKHLAAHPPSSDSPLRIDPPSVVFTARWDLADWGLPPHMPQVLYLFDTLRPIYCHTLRLVYPVGDTLDAKQLRELGVDVPPDCVLEGWVKGMTV